MSGSDIISRDLRAHSIPIKRSLAQKAKYHTAHPATPLSISQPYHDLLPQIHWGALPLPADAPLTFLTPRLLYEEAQRWPRPPKLHHASPDKWATKWGKTCKWDNRRSRGQALRSEILRVRDGGWREDEDEVRSCGSGMECRVCEGVRDWEEGIRRRDAVMFAEDGKELDRRWREVDHEMWGGLLERAEERWKDGNWDVVHDADVDDCDRWDIVARENRVHNDDADDGFVLVE